MWQVVKSPAKSDCTCWKRLGKMIGFFISDTFDESLRWLKQQTGWIDRKTDLGKISCYWVSLGEDSWVMFGSTTAASPQLRVTPLQTRTSLFRLSENWRLWTELGRFCIAINRRRHLAVVTTNLLCWVYFGPEGWICGQVKAKINMDGNGHASRKGINQRWKPLTSFCCYLG